MGRRRERGQALVTPMEREQLRRALDGRTQRWLARKSGVNEKTISNILRGYVTRTHHADYDAILRALMGIAPAPQPDEAAVD